MNNFYVCITTIKKYESALKMVLESLPNEWRNKYILVFQKEANEEYKVFDDGHIEVKLKQNLHDYGNWVGIRLLIKNKIVPRNSWFLFVHDTCKFGLNTYECTEKIIKEYDEKKPDVIWLCNTGQCNICLIRAKAIKIGSHLYKPIKEMTKMDTIKYEWNHKHKLSPKSFKVDHVYYNMLAKHMGKRFVYNDANERDVLYYESIDMEKYYYYTQKETDHPKAP